MCFRAVLTCSLTVFFIWEEDARAYLLGKRVGVVAIDHVFHVFRNQLNGSENLHSLVFRFIQNGSAANRNRIEGFMTAPQIFVLPCHRIAGMTEW